MSYTKLFVLHFLFLLYANLCSVTFPFFYAVYYLHFRLYQNAISNFPRTSMSMLSFSKISTILNYFTRVTSAVFQIGRIVYAINLSSSPNKAVLIWISISGKLLVSAKISIVRNQVITYLKWINAQISIAMNQVITYL